jgi:hypothetical protein
MINKSVKFFWVIPRELIGAYVLYKILRVAPYFEVVILYVAVRLIDMTLNRVGVALRRIGNRVLEFIGDIGGKDNG